MFMIRIMYVVRKNPPLLLDIYTFTGLNKNIFKEKKNIYIIYSRLILRV